LQIFPISPLFTALGRGDPFGISKKALQIVVAEFVTDLTVKILWS